MNRRFALLGSVIAMICLVTNAWCSVVTEKEAITVANNYIEFVIETEGSWGGADIASVQDCNELRLGETTLGYYIAVNPSGYIVVPISHEMPPVKSYSTTDNPDPSSEAGYWPTLKAEMKQRILSIEAHKLEGSQYKTDQTQASFDEAWEWLAGSGPPPDHLVTVGPLLQSKWHQCSPYNDWCPEGDMSCAICPATEEPPPCSNGTTAGCVGIAIAQIMKYWQHPNCGYGSKSNTSPPDCSCTPPCVETTTSPAVFSDRYDWTKIRNCYGLSSGCSIDEEEMEAAAELCFEVAVAVKTRFRRCGSGGLASDVMNALPTYFYYKNPITQYFASSHNEESWFTLIKNELDASPRRPIHYSTDRHSSVCDGYQEVGTTKQIHLNYGRYNEWNVWHTLGDIFPETTSMRCGIEPDYDAVPKKTLTVYAKYISEGIPGGFPDSLNNHVDVTINGQVYETPVSLEVPICSQVTVSAPEWSELFRYSEYFGQGSFDKWDPGYDREFSYIAMNDKQMVVYYDPDVISTRVVSNIIDAVEVWAGPGDTVLVDAGGCRLNSDETIHIEQPLVLISEPGTTPEIRRDMPSDGPSATIIECLNAADVRIGASGQGFRFEVPQDEHNGDGLIRVEGCTSFTFEGNDFFWDVIMNDEYLIDIGLYDCVDCEVSGNSFVCGLIGIKADECSSLVLDSNWFYADPPDSDILRLEYCILLYDCSSAGLSDNYIGGGIWEPGIDTGILLKRCEQVSLHRNRIHDVEYCAISVQNSAQDIVIGGSFEEANRFYYNQFDLRVSSDFTSRLNAECNDWSSDTWEGIQQKLYDPSGWVDFVPWKSGSELKVPFDSVMTTAYATGGATVCPGADIPFGVGIEVLDGSSNPIAGLWCDDVAVDWIPHDPGADSVYLCPGEVSRSPFEGMKTDEDGIVVADMAAMGGCGAIQIESIDGFPLANSTPMDINSPDLNADGVVDLLDFAIFSSMFGSSGEEVRCADYMNGDLFISTGDFAFWSAHFGHECGMAPLITEVSIDRVLGDSPEREPLQPHGTLIDVLVPQSIADQCVACEITLELDPVLAEDVTWTTHEDLHLVGVMDASAVSGGAGRIKIISTIRCDQAGREGDHLLGTLGLYVARYPEALRVVNAKYITKYFGAADLPVRLVSRSGDYTSEDKALLDLTVLEATPNPARGSLAVDFGAPMSQAQRLRLGLYDVRGRLVQDIYEGLNDGVLHSAIIGLSPELAREKSSGMYFLRLYSEGVPLATRKVIILQ